MRAHRPETANLAYSRTFLMAGTALAAVALAACGENRAFEKEANAVRGSKLIVPTAITPPVRVAEVDGAPDDWKMTARVAEALRVRDIPASSVTKSDSAYVLRGSIKNAPSGKPGQMQVTWVLYDPAGKKIGEVTQSAAMPKGQGKTPNDGVVEAMADAAAESIAPIVPSSSVAVADGIETGEAKPNERADREEKNKVTAIGRMKADSGLAKNFADRAAGKTDTKDAAKTGVARNADAPAGRTETTAKPSVTERAAPAPRKATEAARGSLPTGGSALSRNLLREGDSAAIRTPPAAATLPAPRRGEAPARAERPMTEIFTAEDDTSPAGDSGVATRAEEEKTPPRNDVTKAEPPQPAPKAQAPQPAPKPAPKAEPAKTEPVKTEPTKTEPARTEPVKAEPPRDTVTPPADTAKKEPAKPAPKAQVATRSEPARGDGRYWVQIGAHKTAAEAEGQWSKAAAAASAAGAAQHRILRVDLGARGVFHRVQVGPYAAREQAVNICAALKAGGIDCFLQGDTPAAPPAKVSEAPRRVAAAPLEAKPAATPGKPAPVREEAILPDEKPTAPDEIEPVRVAASEYASIELVGATLPPLPDHAWLGDHELAAWLSEPGLEAETPRTYRVLGTPTVVPIKPTLEAPISALPDQRAAADRR